MSQITVLIERFRKGDRDALEALIPQVYEELRAIARRQIGKWKPGMTVSATALVNEAYLSLREKAGLPVSDRAHFFNIAGQCMRWFLLDRAKAKKMQKRGAGDRAVTFNDEIHRPAATIDYLAALDEALLRLRKVDARAAQVAELRYVMGLTIEETAVALGISPNTVKRDWTIARAWLAAELKDLQEAA